MEIYKDKNADIEERVSDLLSRMSAEEKVGQMLQVSYNTLKSEDYEKYKALGIGSFLHVLGAEADEIREKAASSRLGIPPILGIDAIHGHALRNGATVFPSQLAVCYVMFRAGDYKIFVLVALNNRLSQLSDDIAVLAECLVHASPP